MCAVLAGVPTWAMVEYPGARKPGKAESHITESGMRLSNKLIGMNVSFAKNAGLWFGGVEKTGKDTLI